LYLDILLLDTPPLRRLVFFIIVTYVKNAIYVRYCALSLSSQIEPPETIQIVERRSDRSATKETAVQIDKRFDS